MQTVNHMSEKCEFSPQLLYEVPQAAVSWQFDITLFSTYVKSSALGLDLCTVGLVERELVFLAFPLSRTTCCPRALYMSTLYGVLQSSQLGESCLLALWMTH